MRPAIKAVNKKPANSNVSDSAICFQSCKKGSLALSTTGDVKGMMEPQNANELSGLLITFMAISIDTTIGTVIGIISDCWSPSSPMAAPTAANKEP